ncbi:MAG: hypothetical protein Q8N96_03340 [Methylovulum sp.]|nr:hypothetical protein [Methylovulum sp.]
MLQTIEAILEPSGQVRFLEPIQVLAPARVLLTLLEPTSSPERGSAAMLLKRLAENPLKPEFQRTEEEIDAQIEQERNAWD